jgi:hypothetical protein
MSEEEIEGSPRGDLGTLLPDEAYAVACLRLSADPLRPDSHDRPLLTCGREPVCTWDTLFRLLGKAVIKLDPSAQRADRYELTDEWR